MKVSNLKNLIKESVREVFREELKEILLESLKNKNSTPLVEHVNTTPPQPKPSFDIHKLYKENMSDSFGTPQISMNSNNVNSFRPSPGDVVNGSLQHGDVGLDQISSLLNG